MKPLRCPRCGQEAGNRLYPHAVHPTPIAASLALAWRRRPPQPVHWIVCEPCSQAIRSLPTTGSR